MTPKTTPKPEPLPEDTLERITASEDFTGKQRYGMPFEGPHPDELTAEELNRINARWEQFFRAKKGLIDYLAGYDEDLSSIAILSVRRTIALHPDCPDSWLVARAKYDMKSARYWGGCIDNGRRKNQRDDIGSVTGDDAGSFAQRLAQFLSNQQEYRSLAHQGLTHGLETQVLDSITYTQFLNSLDPMERRLIEILRDEYRGDWKWYLGQYATTVGVGNRPKQRFKQEVSPSETDYVVCYAHARKKFYEFFGSEEEARREQEWFKDYVPNVTSLHASRTALYQRTGKYRQQK